MKAAGEKGRPARDSPSERLLRKGNFMAPCRSSTTRKEGLSMKTKSTFSVAGGAYLFIVDQGVLFETGDRGLAFPRWGDPIRKWSGAFVRLARLPGGAARSTDRFHCGEYIDNWVGHRTSVSFLQLSCGVYAVVVQPGKLKPPLPSTGAQTKAPAPVGALEPPVPQGLRQRWRQGGARSYIGTCQSTVWLPVQGATHLAGKLSRERLEKMSTKPSRLSAYLERLLLLDGRPLAADGNYEAIWIEKGEAMDHGPSEGLLVRHIPTVSAEPPDSGVRTGSAGGETTSKAAGDGVGRSPHQSSISRLKREVGRAFRTPLEVGPPMLPSSHPGNYSLEECNDGFDDGGDAREVTGGQPAVDADPTAVRREAEKVRRRIRQSGFEAVACYGSFHSYDHWGIVIDREAVRRLAEELALELQTKGAGGIAEAMQAIKWLVWEHEFFHARADAFAMRHELSGGTPKYRRYTRAVYRMTLHTRDNLEEALANWRAYWALAERMEHLVCRGTWRVEARGIVLQYVQGLFARSPRGYSDWRKGSDPHCWRLLAAQILTGRLSPARRRTVSQAAGELYGSSAGYLKPADVKVWWAVPTDRTRPFAPTAREVRAFLRRLGWTEDRKAGKGSHAKWRSPDGKHSWPLPEHSELSRTVFKSLLKLLGMDEGTYRRLRQEF
jgi:predicted RNA binding protein YcfA (HicA-like mRNA interferase family)